MLLPHLIDKLNIDKLNEIDKFQVLNEIVNKILYNKDIEQNAQYLEIYI